GRLAKKGDSVTVDGHRLTVLEADPTRIRRVRVEPVREVSKEDGEVKASQ
ncbi:MAG TPA: transporter associated domain-containing protein, partial [Isosphaeraceae bacterium]|nr:transporter associated domain-containing protein [Isosphaeraceae bacterium]